MVLQFFGSMEKHLTRCVWKDPEILGENPSRASNLLKCAGIRALTIYRKHMPSCVLSDGQRAGW